MPIASVDPASLDTPRILRRVTEASRQLAEFKGIVTPIPNQRILLNSLALQEAKDSSAIENIVTTHDELFRHLSGADGDVHPAAKEVLRYREALDVGWRLVSERHPGPFSRTGIPGAWCTPHPRMRTRSWH